MTNEEWSEEAEAAVAGTAWRVFWSASQKGSPIFSADFINAVDRRIVHVMLDRAAFQTAAERQAEILRRLGAA